MFQWSEKRIEWYQRAVAYNGFDVALADAIEGYLPTNEIVCDLGCGTGYLAMELAQRRYSIIAFDKSGIAMDYLRRQKELRGLNHLQLVEGDWFHIGHSPLWDNAVMAFAGHLDVDMEMFLGLVRKRLVLIVKDNDQSHVQANGISPLKHVTGDQVASILKGKHYQRFALTAQFGQPLKSISEARDYLWTYGADIDSPDSALTRIERTGDPNYPYYLPSEKSMQVFVIEK